MNTVMVRDEFGKLIGFYFKGFYGDIQAYSYRLGKLSRFINSRAAVQHLWNIGGKSK